MINIQNKFRRRELDQKSSLKPFQERLCLSRDNLVEKEHTDREASQTWLCSWIAMRCHKNVDSNTLGLSWDSTFCILSSSQLMAMVPGHPQNSKTLGNYIIQLLDIGIRGQTLHLDYMAWNSTSVTCCVILVNAYYSHFPISHLKMKKILV